MVANAEKRADVGLGPDEVDGEGFKTGKPGDRGPLARSEEVVTIV